MSCSDSVRGLITMSVFDDELMVTKDEDVGVLPWWFVRAAVLCVCASGCRRLRGDRGEREREAPRKVLSRARSTAVKTSGYQQCV